MFGAHGERGDLRRGNRGRALALGAAFLCVSLGIAAADAPTGVVARSGDKLTTAIDTAADTDIFTVEIAEGAQLGVTVGTAKKAPKTLFPGLRIWAPDGSEVAPPGGIKGVGEKTKIKLKKLDAPVGTTGVWRVEVAGTAGTAGAYTAAFSVKPPRPVKLKGLVVPESDSAIVGFGATDGATVTVNIKVGDGAIPTAVFIVGPDGNAVPGGAITLTTKGKKTTGKAKKVPLASGFGLYSLVVDGGTEAGAVDVKLKVKWPKITDRNKGKVPLPPELELTGVGDGDVRQEAVRARLDVSGAGFLPGTSATISGDGVTVDAVSIVDADSLAVDVTVAADAPFGLRDLVVVPPPREGEPKTLTDAVRVLAPLPAISGTSTPIVKQNDDEATVVVAGTGFREGGSVEIEEPGITLTGVVVDSADQLTLTMSVDNDATLGPRDVTYTQPTAGGGDAVTAVDLIRVDFPDPVIDAVTPSVLQQGATAVVVALDGAGFRDGASVAVTGTGVAPTQPTRVSDTEFEVTVDVDDDATYGVRDLSITQSVVGGGATGTAQGAFTVVAPDPIIASISPAALDQGATNVLITVTGQHFRDGGSVALTGSGVTVSDFALVSNTQVTFRVDLDDAASLGPQTLTYTQPVAGGGAATDLAGALQVNAPQPTATSISVASVKQLQTGVEVTFTGGELRPGGTVSFSGSGVTGTGTTVDSRSVARVTIDVAEFAAVGLRDATFTQPVVGGGRSATLTDVLTVLHPDPTMSGIDSVGVRRTKVGAMRLSGTAFRDGCTITTTGTGVTLGTPVVVSATEIDLPYVVAADAPLTQRNLTYTQPAAGGAATTTLTDAYGVFSAPPEFTSITPNVFRPGDTFVPVVILGVDFEDNSTVALGATGVTTEDFDFVSITRFDALASFASTASIGTGDVILQPPAGPPEVFEDVFSVIHADPTITGTSHPTLARGSDALEIEIHGTGFLSGATIAASGSGVTFANVSVESSTLITADVDVTGTATLGARSLTVTHPSAAGGRAATRADVFQVVGTAPTVTAINPPKIATTPIGGVTRLVTAYVTGTGFATGSSVSVSRTSGTGISVVSGSANVLSDTELEVRLSVAGGATTGTWDVQVTNPDGGGSGTTGDDVLDIGDETMLTVNQVVPALGSTYGGERVTVYGGGFVIGAVVDFGSERALRTQVIDENTLVCTVPQPSSASQAAPTEVTVTIRPSSSSSGVRVDAYAYARDTQTMYADSSFPAHGATGVPATLARTCVRLSGPSGSLPAFGGTASGWPEQSLFWFEDGSSAAASGAATLDASKRWLVFTRDTTSPLPANNQGLWRATVPATVVSLSGRNLVEVHKTADGDDLGYDTFDYTINTSASDTTAPTVSSFTPAASSANVSTITPIVVVMSEEVDPLTVTTTNITLRQGSTVIPFHIDLADDLRTVTLSPHAELTTSRTYTTRVTTGVKDLHGNAVASQVASSFATQGGSDTEGPTIESVVIEGLPSSVDGSGTYVSGADSTGSASNPQAAGAGSSVAYDLFVPRSGFELCVTYTDNGGVGINESSFSATCSVAIGSTSANTELASLFDVSSVRAVWRVPSTSLIATGENVTFSFSINDVNGNASSTGTVTLDVAALTTTSQAGVGGNLDPFDTRQTWVLRTDLDAYTSTFYEETLSAITYPRMTTTNTGNDANDLDEALLLVGLETDSMTSAAGSAVNGVSNGTNQIMRRLVSERIRELVRERFSIDADGTRDADSPEIEFLLPGEVGSLSALPAYASSSSTSSSSAFSEISIAGTKGAESSGSATALINSASAFDVRNLNQDALVNTDGTYGVFLTSMLKDRLGDGRFDAGGTRGMYRPFGRYVLEDFNATWGGTPVGEHASDDDVLAAGFDRSTSANTTHNDRYDAIHTAIETIALWASCNVALEVGQATGLVPDGGPKTGLFGHAHRNNTFTDATTTALNVSHRIYWAGMNNLMAPDGTLFEKIRTGSDSRRFNPLALAWLQKRVLYDEGQ